MIEDVYTGNSNCTEGSNTGEINLDKIIEVVNKIPKITPAIVITDIEGLATFHKVVPQYSEPQKGGQFTPIPFFGIPVMTFTTEQAHIEAIEYCKKEWKVFLIIGNKLTVIQKKNEGEK